MRLMRPTEHARDTRARTTEARFIRVGLASAD